LNLYTEIYFKTFSTKNSFTANKDKYNPKYSRVHGTFSPVDLHSGVRCVIYLGKKL